MLIEYYGSSGTGFKHAASIYLFNSRNGRFSTVAINLPNPTFYREQQIITAYYIGLGGGYAFTPQWKGMMLDTLETIAVDIRSEGDQLLCVSETGNRATGKVTTRKKDAAGLPPAYRYARYAPVISRTPN
ncbi:hypothetical protein [Taibaiella helva]|uniref:hypothetical protein n=1 Tax=Taibaiella helva TaxID=2301235 RepID=UPI000E56DE00|nr:hypothetical protein [Taibaiella helva]